MDNICISGKVATGKTEVATLVSKELNYELYKASDTFREFARKMNMDIVKFSEYVKENKDIDYKIEEITKKILSERKNLVVDARMGFVVCKSGFKVFMESSLDVAARRLFEASKTRGKEEKYESVEKAKQAILQRETLERERYLSLYGVDIYDMNNYDLVIDTTKLTVKETCNVIVTEYLKRNKGKN